MHKYTNRFYQLLDEMKSLHDKKRHDYAQEQDPFANFRLSELGGIDAWKGIAVRLGDKYSRLMSFIDKGELKFKEENIKTYLLFQNLPFMTEVKPLRSCCQKKV